MGLRATAEASAEAVAVGLETKETAMAEARAEATTGEAGSPPPDEATAFAIAVAPAWIQMELQKFNIDNASGTIAVLRIDDETVLFLQHILTAAPPHHCLILFCMAL